MKKVMIAILALAMSTHALFAKNADAEMVDIAKIYAEFQNEPITDEALSQLKAVGSRELQFTKEFMIQVLTENNQLLGSRFLTAPDEIALKQIYTIRLISLNELSKRKRSNEDIITELSLRRVRRLNMIEAYYDVLFKSVAAKNKDQDLSNANFVFNNYGLASKSEQGMFYLHLVDMLGESFFAGIQVSKANLKEALAQIEKLPQINGQPYYQFRDFAFTDVKERIVPDKGEISVKHHYLAKYYDMLMWHAVALSQKGKYAEQKEHLVLNSILDNHQMYGFANYPDAVVMIRQSLK